MGSSGSGKFGNYRIGESNNIGGNGSGGPGEIECPTLIENIKLEDIASSDYYKNNGTLPSAGTDVQLREVVHLGRVVVETVDSHVIIGNLPTQYNYLLACLKKGMHYAGQVISSGVSPISFVVVTLNA